MKGLHSNGCLEMYINILLRVLVTETGFGLVIGFINHLHVVTTINYNTVTNYHSRSTPRRSSQSDLFFPSVLLVPIRSLVRVLLLRLLFTRNWTITVTAFTSPHLELSSFGTELFGILPVSRYIDFARITHRKPSCIVASRISRRGQVTWLPASTVGVWRYAPAWKCVCRAVT
jgi:hypothetical protein